MINLDFLAAKHGQPLAFDDRLAESTVNTALSILHEQGIYALWLWLHEDSDQARKDKRAKIGERIEAFLRDDESPIDITDKSPIWSQENVKDSLDKIRNQFSSDLRQMFFCKELISHMLIYARHGTKTLREPEEAAAPTQAEAPTT